MIRAYTTNDSHAKIIRDAAEQKHFECEVLAGFDPAELEGAVEDLSILVFDLTCAAFSAGDVMSKLDQLDSDQLPPVLYLLASPSDIQLIAQAGSIVNQDYSFIPTDAASLAGRFEVLNMLGTRRRLSLETAITDRTTGLCNRKYFIRRLEEELYRAVRYKYNVGVLMVDIDFSAKDGELTEECSSIVIKQVASFFRERLRKSDIVGRFKWDDFTLLLPDIPPEDSLAVANDVKAKLEALELSADGVQISLKPAVSHVSYPLAGANTAIDVIHLLEDGCLAAKATGNNEVNSIRALASDT